jgi:drug/metabolite transporter (DMT)-like permease
MEAPETNRRGEGGGESVTEAFSRGIRYAAAGAFSFSVMSAFAKLVGGRIPTQEIVLARALVVVPLSLANLRRRGLSPWGTERGLLLLRGLFGYGALSCFFWAVMRLPLADTTVIHFTNPVFTAFLAALFLGEILGGREILLALTALGGVVLVARPGFLFGEVSALDPVAVGVALSGAILAAGAYVTARRLTRTHDPMVIVFAFAVVMLAGSLPATIPVFVLPQGREWVFLLVMALASYAGQVFVTRALQTEKAGRVMAVGYLQIVFAAVWGLVLFREIPDLWTATGAGVIIASTFLLGRIRPPAGSRTP